MEDAIAIMISNPMSTLPDNALNKDNIRYVLDDTITPEPEHKLNVLKQLIVTIDSYDPIGAFDMFMKISPIVRLGDEHVELLSILRQRIAFNLFDIEGKNYPILRFIFQTIFTDEQNDLACDKVIKTITPSELSTGINSTIVNSESEPNHLIFSRVLLDRYKNNERFSRKVKLTSLELYEELEKYTSY